MGVPDQERVAVYDEEKQAALPVKEFSVNGTGVGVRVGVGVGVGGTGVGMATLISVSVVPVDWQVVVSPSFNFTVAHIAVERPAQIAVTVV